MPFFPKRIAHHQQIWELFRAGYKKEEIARLVGVGSRTVYRVLGREQPPPRERRTRTHRIADPYLSHLSNRWNEGCHTATQLYEEVMAQGYTGSLRTMNRIVRDFREKRGKKYVDAVLFPTCYKH